MSMFRCGVEKFCIENVVCFNCNVVDNVNHVLLKCVYADLGIVIPDSVDTCIYPF